jgi:hypothetical protein
MNSSAAITSPLLSGRYRLAEKLGEGRLAVVYNATDESLHRRVLVHMLRKELVAQESLVQRFETEISASAQRSHPALLQVYDSGEEDDRLFMVTDYVEGQTLRAASALSFEHALLYMRQIAGAVAVCQARDLPHPPVSSSNILVVSEGQVKLVENWQMSSADVTLDLAHYRAPELTEGSPPAPASTVYALGLLLYELLTGSRPVQGNDALDVAQAHLHLHLAPLEHIRPLAYLPALDTLLYRATARVPEQRFPDAASFAAALDAFWRTMTTGTQRLAVPQAAPAPQPAPEARYAAPQPAAGQSSMPAPAPAPARVPAPAPASAGSTRARMRQMASADYWRRQSRIRAASALVMLLIMVSIAAFIGYAGASYLANRMFDVQLPEISMPEIDLGLPEISMPEIDLGLPEINVPEIDLGLPEWMTWDEQGDVLIVNINGGLNMRNEPGLNTDIVAVVPNGTRVQRLEGPVIVDNVPWVRVRVEGNGASTEGWMSLNYLQAEG